MEGRREFHELGIKLNWITNLAVQVTSKITIIFGDGA
jgi:hypothetical protein